MLTNMKGEINNKTIIAGDFNIPHLWIISKETQTLNDTMNQLDLIDIYRTFHPKTNLKASAHQRKLLAR